MFQNFTPVFKEIRNNEDINPVDAMIIPLWQRFFSKN
jgi:hypothetical protein